MELFDSEAGADGEPGWYVDREDVCNYVAARLHWQLNEPSKVTVFHGPGGVGKTVARKLLERTVLQDAGVPYVVVDYEPDEADLRSCERTFSYVRRRLGQFGLSFPIFDLVWSRHWEETTRQRLSKTNFPSELSDASDVLSVIPILGNLPAALIALTHLSRSAANSFTQRFKDSGVGALQGMTAIELLHVMPEAIARDLEECMAHKKNRGKRGDARITVVLDAYERLLEHGIDDWFIRDFCRSSASTVKIIFGREALTHWQRLQPQWIKFIDNRPQMTNLVV